MTFTIGFFLVSFGFLFGFVTASWLADLEEDQINRIKEKTWMKE